MTPEQLVAVLTALTALVGALLAVWREVRRTHALINSRMDMLLELTATSSHARGVIQGQQTQQTPKGPVIPLSEDTGPVASE